MDQEEKLDFRALRAKFQDEELLLKQPLIKPALPEKPKIVPPPQSPTYLPAGARPSLLTSISQTLEGKSAVAPRVVFKKEEESKNLLLQTKKDKSEGKLKKGKDKPTKGSKEKLSEDPKQKNGKDKKVSTAELVPATPPPKGMTGKKGFPGLKKTKKDLAAVQADPILDTPSADNPGQTPLIPVPPDSKETTAGQETSAPKALLPNIPTILDAGLPVEIAPLSILDCPPFTPPPSFIPDNPTPAAPTPVSEPPLKEIASLPVSIPALQSETTPSPPSIVSTPPPSQTICSSDEAEVGFTSSPSPPKPEGPDGAAVDEVQAPPTSVLDPSSLQSSPKVARSISALSALERAEDMSPGKRTAPCDLRIFNALEKARRKPTSQQNNPSSSYSTLPSGDLTSPTQSPTGSLPELPPIDYEDRLRNTPPILVQMNGLDHASPMLDDITEEGPDAIPEMLVVPPPPPRKFFPEPSLGAALGKTERPPSVNLSHFLPPQLDNTEIPPPPQFSETCSTDISVFEDLCSEAQTPELPVSNWASGECTHLDSIDGQNLPDHFSNGLIIPTSEVPLVNPDSPLAESSFSTAQASLLHPGLQNQDYNGVSECTDAVSEDASKSKKKVKTEGGRKRKGPPKNPYVETPQESNEEKSKTGRFGKNDRKAEGPDDKELKKKEKQRLEKEKKELKEKQERERKEQKEREKKENEMKKKFKITGQEETLYQATVMVTAKGRKHDLPVKTGDHISIIRTTNCPKGKWLARDSSNNYGHVSVEHVELDIKEMLELGKKAATIHKGISSPTQMDSAGINRLSNHLPLSDSFTDDSEEWTGDEEELSSPPPQSEDPLASVAHTRALSMPDMGIKDLSVTHQHSHSDISADNSNVQARQEALQKLATFFYSTKPVEPAASSAERKMSLVLVKNQAVNLPGAVSSEELDLKESESDMIILPPPELYADLTEA